MIEIVYKENAREAGTRRKPDLPKNVRQIGEPEFFSTYTDHLKREAGK